MVISDVKFGKGSSAAISRKTWKARHPPFISFRRQTCTSRGTSRHVLGSAIWLFAFIFASANRQIAQASNPGNLFNRNSNSRQPHRNPWLQLRQLSDRFHPSSSPMTVARQSRLFNKRNDNNGEISTGVSSPFADAVYRLQQGAENAISDDELTTDVPWFKAVWDFLPMKKICEFGIWCYLFWALVKAASDVVSEFTQEVLGTESTGFSREQISEVLRFLELDPKEAKDLLERAQMDPKAQQELPSLSILSLAQKLSLVGLSLRRGQPSVESILLTLSRAEISLLQQCLWVPPSKSNENRQGSPTSSWDDIIGLDRVKRGLMSALKSITKTHLQRKSSQHATSYDSLFEHSSGCTGVLLYGPPGCGKSFLIKSMSAQSKLPCLVITPSVLLRKYVGETNQQCRSLFSLAQKLAPCILCIDEVDALFRERSDSEHEVSRDLKTEFLQHLDGMMSASDADRHDHHGNHSGHKRRNLVVAATNRPFDVDSAILRRLTQSFFVPMPDVAGRSMLLQQMLKSVPTSETEMDIWFLSTKTEGYSPSDLRQLLQEAAASGPLREQEEKTTPFRMGHGHFQVQPPTVPRPLTTNDVLEAMNVVSPTHMSSQYRWSLANFAQGQNPERNQPQTKAGDGSTPTFWGSNGNGGGTQNQDHVVSKWETDYGNFYHLGALQIDSNTWEKLTELAETIVEITMEEEDDEEDDPNDPGED